MFTVAIIFSYLIGSIPVGYIFARALKGIDIRRYGSGNVGATNVFRVLGSIPGVIVLTLDMLKGLLPVVVIANFVSGFDHILVRLILGLAAVCGHNWTIFLKFRGGKGVATTAGALLGLSLKVPHLGMIVLLCLGIWVLVLLATGFVSLSSILASITLPIFMLIFAQPLKLLIFAVLLCLFVLVRHKSNIGRLLRGEEKRIFP
jgi:glycerol-3-phosphate acyltransferase PlsY